NQLKHPTAIAFGESQLWIADTNNGRVQALTLPSGAAHTIYAPSEYVPTALAMADPLPLDPSSRIGSVWVADATHTDVCTIDNCLPNAGSHGSTVSMTADPLGDVFFADSSTGVWEEAADSTEVQLIAMTGASAVAADANADLFVADQTNHLVVEYPSTTLNE